MPKIVYGIEKSLMTMNSLQRKEGRGMWLDIIPSVDLIRYTIKGETDPFCYSNIVSRHSAALLMSSVEVIQRRLEAIKSIVTFLQIDDGSFEIPSLVTRHLDPKDPMKVRPYSGARLTSTAEQPEWSSRKVSPREQKFRNKVVTIKRVNK